VEFSEPASVLNVGCGLALTKQIRKRKKDSRFEVQGSKVPRAIHSLSLLVFQFLFAIYSVFDFISVPISVENGVIIFCCW
jgi:hypothetical protein